ncbi:hypothetical protein HK096_003607, partial [Nowakowskiella sp. JEL0078]
MANETPSTSEADGASGPLASLAGFFAVAASEGLVSAAAAFPLSAAALSSLALLPFAAYSYLANHQPREAPLLKPAFGLQLSRVWSAAEIAAAASHPSSKVIWQLGISSRAVAISEDGNLRCIEFTPSGDLPTSNDIVSAIMTAISSPHDSKHLEIPFVTLRPRVISVLQTRQCEDIEVTKAIEQLKDLDIRIDLAENLENEIEDMKKEWSKEIQEKARVELAKKEYAPQPNRVCFVCRNEVVGKNPQQCGNCKAVLYCSTDCAKKDWPNHKLLCPMWKTTMKRAEDESFHNLPFPWYPKTKFLCTYNMALFLSKNAVHNAGVYRRLCHCFDNVPYGELGALTQKIDDPKSRFNELGIPEEFYPLNKKFKGDVKNITGWEKYYESIGIPLDSPVAMALECPLTVFHLINKYLIPRMSASKEKIRKITIHMISCTYEADLVHLFEILVPLFPNTDLTIHMFGQRISPNLTPTVYKFSNVEISSTLKITLRQGTYLEPQMNGEGEHLEGKFPDSVICLNAPVNGPQSNMVPWKILVESPVRSLVTVSMESSALFLESMLLRNTGGRFTFGVRPTVNPFRQPCFEFQQDVNLPAWSNGF